MRVSLGVDTLCYHCRIVTGDITIEDTVREIASLGGEFVQVNSYHLRNHRPAQIERLRELSDSLGLGPLTLAGGNVGLAGHGDTVEHGADVVADQLQLALLLGSPYVRMSSGFYRAELWREPDRIAAEHDYVVKVLTLAADRNDTGLKILLENHSDFTPAEYVEIIEQVGPDRLGVFLDLINPVSTLMDPLQVSQALFPWAPAGHIKDFRFESEYVEDGFHRRGFAVKWCYPGEGVVDIAPLVEVITSAVREGTYLLSIEGLDNRPDVADQHQRLTAALAVVGGLTAQG